MKLESDEENKVKRIALEYAKRGRQNWDVPHTKAVVFYMKKLLDGEGGNERVLIPAAYLHDIGYVGLLAEGYSYEDNIKVKPKHMEKGAEMARGELNDIDSFSDEEIEEIARLISIHDELDKIEGHDVQLLFEADSLGMVDVDRVEPNFSEEDYNRWLEEEFKAKRVPLFKSETGKKHLSQLLSKAESYFLEE